VKPDPDAFAALIADYCLEIKEGQEIIVRSTTLATPLLLALQKAIMERDAWCILRPELEGEQLGFYEAALGRHLDLYPQIAYEDGRKLHATVGIQAPFETGSLETVDPEKIHRMAVAREPIRDELRKHRWSTTVWPTPALAKKADMTLPEFSAFVERSMFLDRPDPVAAWVELRAFQNELIKIVGKTDELHIEAPGTDLKLSVRKRGWVNSDGKRNMPSGEIFTGPIEDSVNGHIYFSIQSSPPGVEVSGVRLVFKDGKVVEATAEKGEDYLRKAVALDPGSCQVGEIGIGTNFGIDRPTGTILFDEKIGGTVHLALGRSYPETGGKVNSAIHWDLICDLRAGGRLTADGKVLQQDGKFVS
jgi:aminopeptidase